MQRNRDILKSILWTAGWAASLGWTIEATGLYARADDAAAPATSEAPAFPAPQTPAVAPAPSAPPAVNRGKSRPRRRSDRDTEGTEAHDRFEAETVIKSQYTLHGEPLEVDPD